MRGLGNYTFEEPDVAIEKRGAIKIKSIITWPSITLDATGMFWINRTNAAYGSGRHELNSSVMIFVKSPVGIADVLVLAQVQTKLKSNQIRLSNLSAVDIQIHFTPKRNKAAVDLRFLFKTSKNILSTKHWNDRAQKVVEEKIISHLLETTPPYLSTLLAPCVSGEALNTFYSGAFCDVGNATMISACARQTVESDRQSLKTQVGPLYLQSVNVGHRALRWDVSMFCLGFN